MLELDIVYRTLDSQDDNANNDSTFEDGSIDT